MIWVYINVCKYIFGLLNRIITVIGIRIIAGLTD